MVDIVGLATSLASAPQQISKLLDGSFLNAPVQLGSFAFKRFEVPEKIEFGASQRLVVHKLLGNGRVVDALGRDDKEISWSGLFLGSNAVKRYEALEAIRDAATPIDLDWGDLHRHVMVQDLTPSYFGAGRIEYSIVCQTVPEDTGDDDDTGLDDDDPSIFDSISDTISDIGSTISDAEDQVSDFIAPVTAALGSIQSIVSPIANSLGVTIPCLGSLAAGLPGVATLAIRASTPNATSANYQALDGALAAQQTAVSNVAASSTTALTQVAANVATASQPALQTGVVASQQDFACAYAAIAAQFAAITASGPLTSSRQQLALAGSIPAAAFPTLQTATNDLVQPQQTITNPVVAAQSLAMAQTAAQQSGAQ